MVAEGVFSTGSLSSYCTVDDVFNVLRGYDLEPYGGRAGLEERVEELLVVSRSAVDRYARRDFFRHHEATVVMDGSGTDRQLLTELGIAPPANVHEVRISGETLGAEEWCAYGDQGLVRLTASASLSTFPVGVQNVEMLLDWGFEAPPGEVVYAQAKIAAAELLGELGGEAGGVTNTRIGDYTVSYASEGKYAGAVAPLIEEAKDALGRYRVVRMRAV